MPVAVGRIPGWVLIGLCFGMSVLAETDPEFSECSQSFYKQTPPAGFLVGQLQPRCHSLGTGQSFAAFHSTFCDSTVLSAFCLDKAWRGTAGHSQEGDGAETDTEDAQTGTEEKDKAQIDEKDLPATMPALLRREGYNVYTSSDTPANSWDALLSELVQNNIHPQCRSLGGDLYVLTGTGGLGELGQGCEVGLLWSAMCCAVPNEEAVFSVAVVKMGEEEARVLDVKGLEEVAGVGGVFLGGCGEADGGESGGIIALFQNAVQQIIEKHNTDTQPDSSNILAESATQSDSSDTLAESTTQSDSSDTLAESATQSDSSDTLAESATQTDSSDMLAESATQPDSSDTQAESTTQTDSSDTLAESATQPDSSDTQAESTTQSDSSDTLAESATQSDSSDTLAESATQSDSSDTLAESATQSDSSDTLADSTAAESTDAPSEEAEGGSTVVKSRRSVPLSAHEESSARASQAADTEPSGNSTFRYLLSCSLWLVSTPFRPITSTLTQMPGQLSHVIWEDLSVLSTLPGVTFSLLYNVVADAAWGGVSAVGLAGKAGTVCASKLYACTSPLVGALLYTCQDGVMGVGTLTWDGVGIVGGVVNRAWSVSRYVGGRAWEQSEGFLWAVLSELGSQSKRVGGGLGKLVLQGGKGVANVVCVAGRIVGGTLTLAVEGVKEVFGDN